VSGSIFAPVLTASLWPLLEAERNGLGFPVCMLSTDQAAARPKKQNAAHVETTRKVLFMVSLSA
jgi:hypothetical protein